MSLLRSNSTVGRQPAENLIEWEADRGSIYLSIDIVWIKSQDPNSLSPNHGFEIADMLGQGTNLLWRLWICLTMATDSAQADMVR